MIFNIIIILIVLVLTYFVYEKNSLNFVFLLPFIVQYLWMFLSILVIENGTFVSEQRRNGEFVYANFFLLCFFIVSILSFTFFFKIFTKLFNVDFPHFKFIGLSEHKIILLIALFIIIIGLTNIIVSPSTYTDDTINKFLYWEKSKMKFLKPLLGSTIGYFPFILGILFNKYKKTTIILGVLYVIYLVGVDQKFTAFLFGTISFMMSYIVVNNFYYRKKLRFIKKRYLIIVGCLLFSLVLSKYTTKNPYRHLDLTPFESVFYRAFGLQGHLFWGTSERYLYNNEKSHSWNLGELTYGMHILMEDFTKDKDKKWLKGSWKRGVSWTNAYPSILNRLLPFPLALLFHFFLFSIVPFFYSILYKLLKSRNFLLSIVVFQLILWCINIYTMSYFYRLLKILIIFIFVTFAYHLMNKLRLIKHEKA